MSVYTADQGNTGNDPGDVCQPEARTSRNRLVRCRDMANKHAINST